MIHAIAGFIAYVITCSPTGSRLHSKPLEQRLLMEARKLDASGEVPNAPEALGGKTFTELLDDGTVKFDIDPKFQQAIGVEDFHGRISAFGNSRWEILLNDQKYGPYFTSDYPVAIETFDTDTPINRIVPLAPDLAVRIVPDLSLKGKKTDLSFPSFTRVRKEQRPKSVMELNRKLVQCAEDLVFFDQERDWITKFVAKNRLFRIEPVTFPAVQDGRKGLLVSHRIRERKLSKPE